MSSEETEALAKASAAINAAGRANTIRDQKQEAAILAAREAHMPWSEIAKRLRITEGQARWAVQRRHTPEALSRADGETPRTKLRPGRGPGVSVSEAARTLDVTRRTIYAWARDGRLRSTVNELGQTRLLLEDEPEAETPAVETAPTRSIDMASTESPDLKTPMTLELRHAEAPPICGERQRA